MTGTLIERIVGAASVAIRNQAEAITSDVGELRSITVEVELSSSGHVIDSTVWTERRGVHFDPRSGS